MGVPVVSQEMEVDFTHLPTWHLFSAYVNSKFVNVFLSPFFSLTLLLYFELKSR